MAKLPTVVTNIAPDLRAFVNRVREAIEGKGGNKLVTVNDLIDGGIAVPGPGGTIIPPGGGVVGPPPAPTNVVATGAIQNIIVEWDDPRYYGHAHAEVWGSATDNIGTAVLLGMTPGSIYVDAAGPSVTRYYWVRFVNILDTAGPYNAVGGTLGQTGPAVEYLLTTLTDAALDPAAPYSKFAVRADLFYVVPDVDFNQETTPTATAIGQLWYRPSTDVTRTWTGTTWGPFSQSLPFIVNSSPQTINGVAVPAGVFMDAAFIKNGTITNAKIGNAAIDDAKIANLSAGKITAGSLSVGSYIQSSNYIAGSQGWNIDASGTASFQNAVVRGTVFATSGTIGGVTIASNAIRSGQTAWDTGTGFFLGSDGKFSLGNSTGKKITWNGTNLAISGDITAGTVGGSTVGTTFVRSANYALGSAGWEIDSNGDAEFNQLTVRSGQVIGVLMRAVKVNFFSGLYFEINSGTPSSTNQGPYYFNAGTLPFYRIFVGTMPAPETAAHKIAAVLTVQGTTGSASKDLSVLVVANHSSSGNIFSGEQVSYSTTSGSFALLTSVSGITNGLYGTSVEMAIYVGGNNSATTVQVTDGLFWGVR